MKHFAVFGKDYILEADVQQSSLLLSTELAKTLVQGLAYVKSEVRVSYDLGCYCNPLSSPVVFGEKDFGVV